jgi:hypothetical protein
MKERISKILLFCAFFLAKSTFGQSDFFIIFSAREASAKPFSLAGHAFVSWGIAPKNDSLICSEFTLGFFPNERTGILANIFRSKKGILVVGFLKNSNKRPLQQVIVRTDSLTWLETRDSSALWRTRGYNLIEDNCVKFINDVAEILEMRTPRTNMIVGFPRRPTNYLHRLYRKNRKTVVKRTDVVFENMGLDDNLAYFNAPKLPETRPQKRVLKRFFEKKFKKIENPDH